MLKRRMLIEMVCLSIVAASYALSCRNPSELTVRSRVAWAKGEEKGTVVIA